MKIAVVGATGLVGGVMLEKVAGSTLPVTQLLAVASETSVGQTVKFNGSAVTVKAVQEALDS